MNSPTDTVDFIIGTVVTFCIVTYLVVAIVLAVFTKPPPIPEIKNYSDYVGKCFLENDLERWEPRNKLQVLEVGKKSLRYCLIYNILGDCDTDSKLSIKFEDLEKHWSSHPCNGD